MGTFPERAHNASPHTSIVMRQTSDARLGITSMRNITNPYASIVKAATTAPRLIALTPSV